MRTELKGPRVNRACYLVVRKWTKEERIEFQGRWQDGWVGYLLVRERAEKRREKLQGQ